MCVNNKSKKYVYSQNQSRSAHPSPSLDRLLQHLVALAIQPNAPDQQQDLPPARLELDLARRLLDWLRRLNKGPNKARLAEGMAAQGREQGWSYDVLEGFRLLARGPVPVAAAALAEQEGDEEEGDEI
jgi:hypothetical protein